MHLVSVIIPTYKRSDMLERAVDSILNQSYKNVEIIVVDDNDPDSEWRKLTSEKMKKYTNDNRIVYVCHSSNMNGSVARNTGIEHSKGFYVTYLDDDDIYHLDKIEKQVNFLDANPMFQAVYCGWNRDGNNIVPEGEGDLSLGILSGKNIIITNAIMMRRDSAIECGGWDSDFRRHQEAAYLLNFFRAGFKIGRIDDILIDFDTSDRSNVSNPILTELQLEQLLYKYSDLIQKCEIEHKGSAAEIVTSRRLGTILPYLKCGYYGRGIILLFKSILEYPMSMTRTLISYINYRNSSSFIKQSR